MAANVFLFGASGHGKVVIDIIERIADTSIAFVVDDSPATHGHPLCGYPVIGGREALIANRHKANLGIVTIGDNAARRSVASWLAAQSFAAASAVHPAAAIARDVRIGRGAVVMAGAVINTDTAIGEHVIVNTGATIDHDCAIGDCAHIAPGCHLCGGVQVGAMSLLGAGSTVAPGVRIGSNVVVGAGSTVLQDLPDGLRVAGSPCRPIG